MGQMVRYEASDGTPVELSPEIVARDILGAGERHIRPADGELHSPSAKQGILTRSPVTAT